MKKKIFIIVIILIIVASATAITLVITNKNENQEEVKVITQEELREAYYTQNRFLGLLLNRGLEEYEEQYSYMPVNIKNPNIDGISGTIYEILAFYRKETGSRLTYDQVIDYLSQEFEDDGEVRIYINGRHPEITDYIEWFKKPSWGRNSYCERIRDLYDEYLDENQMPWCSLNLVPTEMEDELIKKEADPDYQMNLKTIQDRYIAEGKAKVSEDGKTIEYIVPEK